MAILPRFLHSKMLHVIISCLTKHQSIHLEQKKTKKNKIINALHKLKKKMKKSLKYRIWDKKRIEKKKRFGTYTCQSTRADGRKGTLLQLLTRIQTLPDTMINADCHTTPDVTSLRNMPLISYASPGSSQITEAD